MRWNCWFPCKIQDIHSFSYFCDRSVSVVDNSEKENQLTLQPTPALIWQRTVTLSPYTHDSLNWQSMQSTSNWLHSRRVLSLQVDGESDDLWCCSLVDAFGFGCSDVCKPFSVESVVASCRQLIKNGKFRKQLKINKNKHGFNFNFILISLNKQTKNTDNFRDRFLFTPLLFREKMFLSLKI